MSSWVSYFSRREWCVMLAMLFATIMATLYAGYRIAYLQEVHRVNESVSAIVRDVHQAFHESRASLKSFNALHYDAAQSEQQFNQSYAKLMVRDSSTIQVIGRFERTANFTLPVTDEAKSANELPTLIGKDFSEDEISLAAILRAVEENRMAIVATPLGWKMGDNLLFVQPGYHYSELPSSDESRRTGFDGGYWASVDLARVMTGFYSKPETARIETSVNIAYRSSPRNADSAINNLSQRTLYAKKYATTRTEWLTFLFPTIHHESPLGVGSGEIVVNVQGRPALSAVNILVGVLLTSFLISLFLMCLSVAVNNRRATRGKMRALRAVTNEREKAESTLNSISESVIALDDEFRVIHMNNAAQAALSVTLEHVVGKPFKDVARLYDSANAGSNFDLPAALVGLEKGEQIEQDVMLYDVQDNPLAMQLSMKNSKENQFHSARYTVVLRDVSAERELTRELEYQANHDPLTDCWNRFYFEKRLQVLVDGAKNNNVNHALVYMDLDQFKIVNDTCGHSAGDRLLVELTRNLNAVLRPGDILARLGGDEFGLLVVNASQDNAVQVAQRIYQFFQNSVFYHEGKAFPVRASIGFVPINRNSGELNDIMSAADMACYSAKDSGRNNLNVYSEENAHISQRHQEMNWLPRLQAALKDNHFQLLVQAVAGTQSGRIEHYEFLLRLRKPDGMIVTPMQFIQAAERYDLMKDIDRWVIRAAMLEIANHDKALGGTSSFSINISGQSAADPELLPFIRECFAESKVDPVRLWFEITETAAITHFQVATDMFEQLRAMGAKVALDDFGSGLSSFGYLKNLPVDIIKIDGQFVRNLDKDQVDQEMVRAIHKVAQTMGIRSVAEFVENEQILKELAIIGVDLAQGFHIARPCPLSEIIDGHSSVGDIPDDNNGLSNAA